MRWRFERILTGDLRTLYIAAAALHPKFGPFYLTQKNFVSRDELTMILRIYLVRYAPTVASVSTTAVVTDAAKVHNWYNHALELQEVLCIRAKLLLICVVAANSRQPQC